MVADYLQAVQPNGPYYLLGWSFGGPLAYAIATHLQDQHESVPLLILLDCYPSTQDVDLSEQTDQQTFADLIRILLDELVSLSSFKECLRQANHPMASLDDSIVQAIMRQFRATPHLLKNFSPRPFHVDLLFFQDNAQCQRISRTITRGLASLHSRSNPSVRHCLPARKDDASRPPRPNRSGLSRCP